MLKKLIVLLSVLAFAKLAFASSAAISVPVEKHGKSHDDHGKNNEDHGKSHDDHGKSHDNHGKAGKPAAQ